MPLAHFCLRCKKFVYAMYDMFKHPHEGMKACYVCRECGAMVFAKEVEKRGVSEF